MTITANRATPATEDELTQGQIKLLAFLFNLAGSIYSRKCFEADRIAEAAVVEEIEARDKLEAWTRVLAELHARIAPAAINAVREAQEPFVSIVVAQKRIDGEPFESMIEQIFEAAGLAHDFMPIPRT